MLKNEPHLSKFATVVAAHEAAHVKTLKGVLGSKAVKKPKFDFSDTTTIPNRRSARC
jgi:hypothetical protein